MSAIPRPPSRSERLLRDTLRKDDTLRASRNDDPEDDDIFQSAILHRCSSRRDSRGFYVPDEDEHCSYSRLLRSSSYSGSSRSACSERRSSPRPQLESRHHDAAPHEAVLRSRLDSVIHGMRIVDTDRDATDASSSSLASSPGSRALSHESHRTHLTVPDPDPCDRPPRSQHAALPRPQPATPPRVRGLRSPPRTPTSHDMDHPHPHSPWMYAPLPPSPPTFSSKRGGPALVTFVATPPAVETHAHSPTRPVPPHSSSTFDPDAASHALRQLPGYVSFASVAGLGAPPEEDDRKSLRKPFTALTLGGAKGRLSSLGLGTGKWWMF